MEKLTVPEGADSPTAAPRPVWTATPPDRPGWWCCGWDWFPGGWQVVWVSYDGTVSIAGSVGFWCVADMAGALWAGPIPEPADPPAEGVTR